MRYRVTHKTAYQYDDYVTLGHNEARLRPRNSGRQTVRHSKLRVQPVPGNIDSFNDYFGNEADFFTLDAPYKELSVIAESEVDVVVFGEIEASKTIPWDALQLEQSQGIKKSLDVLEFLHESPFIGIESWVRDYAQESFPPGCPVLEGASHLMGRVFGDFTYRPGVTEISTPLCEVFRRREGVCQDFAHFQIACLRAMGIPARYASGYLLTTPPPGKEKVRGSDASHAWLSVYCGEPGFVDLDPTNDLLPGDTYITLGWGREYGDVSPLKGVVLGGGSSSFVSVEVDVDPIEGQ